MTDDAFMELALEEARATIGRTSPNPPVGAVLVRNGHILAKGRTAPAGGPHAEIFAMRRAKDEARGATLYTTLEPCCHRGRTGPCTEAIIDAGIERVVIGCRDENPQVSGRGIAALRQAGVEVEVGVGREACERIARPFFTWVSKGRPYVVLKAAATMDGRIATPSGHSRWVTGEEARARVHKWRDRFDAILVGAGTVSADDPALTTRLAGGGGRDPVRVVLDGRMSTDPGSIVYRQSSKSPTWLVTAADAEPARLQSHLSQGARAEGGPSGPASSGGSAPVEVIQLPGEDGRVDIWTLAEKLAEKEMVSLLVEGGTEVHGAFVAAGIVDEIRLFVAPKLLGGGPPWLSMKQSRIPSSMDRAISLSRPTVEAVGDDVLIVSRLG